MVWLIRFGLVKQYIRKTFKMKKQVSSQNVLPFSIAISCAKVCGGENGGSGGGKVYKLTLVIRLGSKPKLINNTFSFCFSNYPSPMTWFKKLDLVFVWFGWFGLVWQIWFGWLIWFG